jgi:hypothetical protein
MYTLTDKTSTKKDTYTSSWNTDVDMEHGYGYGCGTRTWIHVQYRCSRMDLRGVEGRESRGSPRKKTGAVCRVEKLLDTRLVAPVGLGRPRRVGPGRWAGSVGRGRRWADGGPTVAPRVGFLTRRASAPGSLLRSCRPAVRRVRLDSDPGLCYTGNQTGNGA